MPACKPARFAVTVMVPSPLPDAGDTASHVPPEPASATALQEKGAEPELREMVWLSGALDDEFADPVNNTPPGIAPSVPGTPVLPRSSTTGTSSVFAAPVLCTE